MMTKQSSMWNSISSIVIMACGCAAFIVAGVACMVIHKNARRDEI